MRECNESEWEAGDRSESMQIGFECGFECFACSMQGNFHIGCGDLHHFCHLFVGTTVDFAQLQCGALFLGEGVEHTLHPQHAFLLFELLVGMRGVESDLGGRGVEGPAPALLRGGALLSAAHKETQNAQAVPKQKGQHSAEL